MNSTAKALMKKLIRIAVAFVIFLTVTIPLSIRGSCEGRWRVVVGREWLIETH